jgi:uncharacterized membrane protein YecN with MAPEG domain
MPSPLPLPVTLITACILALIKLVLAFRVGQARFKYRVAIGDGGHPDMLARIRTHANFAEYVPLILILMGLLEISSVNRIGLMVMGVLVIIFRIMHAIGMPRQAPNIFRTTGAGGTALVLAVAAIWGLFLALTA